MSYTIIYNYALNSSLNSAINIFETKFSMLILNDVIELLALVMPLVIPYVKLHGFISF